MFPTVLATFFRDSPSKRLSVVSPENFGNGLWSSKAIRKAQCCFWPRGAERSKARVDDRPGRQGPDALRWRLRDLQQACRVGCAARWRSQFSRLALFRVQRGATCAVWAHLGRLHASRSVNHLGRQGCRGRLCCESILVEAAAFQAAGGHSLLALPTHRYRDARLRQCCQEPSPDQRRAGHDGMKDSSGRRR
jgi:hypothetical protein